MPELQLPGYVAHFERAGTGRPLLFMPGALGTGSGDFAAQIEFFSRHYEVIAPDPRGYGRSRPPERDFPSDFYERDGADALALMDALGHHSFAALGWSDGANSATVVAASHPGRVAQLVIWGGNPSLTLDELHSFQSIRSLSTWSPRALEPMRSVYGDDLPSLWERYVAGLEALHFAGGDLYTASLARVHCPTLILHGDLDPLVPLHHPLTLHRGIVGSELIRFPDGKNISPVRYAAEFTRLVASFLERTAPSQTTALASATSNQPA